MYVNLKNNVVLRPNVFVQFKYLNIMDLLRRK